MFAFIVSWTSGIGMVAKTELLLELLALIPDGVWLFSPGVSTLAPGYTVRLVKKRIELFLIGLWHSSCSSSLRFSSVISRVRTPSP